MAEDTARIRSDIEQTREELGETARALAGELDPRTRTARAAQDARQEVRTRLERLADAVRDDPRLLAPVAVVVLLVAVRRRRRRR